MEKNVLIAVENGLVSVLEQPDDVDVEIRCYDLDEFNGDDGDLLTEESEPGYIPRKYFPLDG